MNATLTALQRTLDLDPVVLALLGAMVATRVALYASLHGRRRLRRRGTVKPRPGVREGVMEWLDAGILAVLVVYCVVRPFVAQVLSVTSASMAPTLQGSPTPQIDGPNDHIVVSKYLYRFRAPRRGEVVLFDPPPNTGDGSGDRVVKRLVALPGDTVQIDQAGRLVINGEPQDETYLRERSNVPFPKRQVPPGCYFVLGDNRNASLDSAHWPDNPFLPEAYLRGKAVAICWPPDRMKLLP